MGRKLIVYQESLRDYRKIKLNLLLKPLTRMGERVVKILLAPLYRLGEVSGYGSEEVIPKLDRRDSRRE